MRKDPYSNELVPETLREYKIMCSTLFGEHSRSVKFFERKIAESDHNDKVMVPHNSIMQIIHHLENKDLK